MNRAIGTIAVLAALAPVAAAADPQALAEAKQCFSCHSVDRDGLAPSFRLLARNYARIANADRMLERRIRSGSVGHWGAESMPADTARPAVSEAEARELVAWILTLK